jgi:hypothetical protein
MRRLLALLVLVLAAWAGPGSPPAQAMAMAARSAAPFSEKLVLEDFFRGRLVAEGEFLNSRDGSRRGVKVRMHGAWDGRVLTLVEDFVYSDGEKDRKTWRFTKVAEGRYVGTREDVIGEAEVLQDGKDVTLAYTATVRTKDGGSYSIRFKDRLALIAPRTVLNTATLSWFVFDVGRVNLTIHRLGR